MIEGTNPNGQIPETTNDEQTIPRVIIACVYVNAYMGALKENFYSCAQKEKAFDCIGIPRHCKLPRN